MATNPTDSKQEKLLNPRFEAGFLSDHAGRIIKEPDIALVELVANAWDAGATRVDLRIPNEEGEELSIEDNGIGMTADEFRTRWMTLSYNRRARQGPTVKFPAGNGVGSRKAFGKNGKGRHAMFCFGREYTVETWRQGQCSIFEIEESAGEGPFESQLVEQFERDGHGTRLSVVADENLLPPAVVREFIGSRFATDPKFTITVNGKAVDLNDLENKLDTWKLGVKDYGEITVHCIDNEQPGRTSDQTGIAYWVNKRLVGSPSWEGLNGKHLDGRTTAAKQYAFIVEADILDGDVEADWTAFQQTERVRAVREAAESKVLEELGTLLSDVRRERKRTAIRENRRELQTLSPLSQETVGRFLDEIQEECPTLSQENLVEVTKVLTNLEESRSQYQLLEELASLDSEGLEDLNTILKSWSVTDALTVLEELGRRLKFIEVLQERVNDDEADELRDIHPLFEYGLWIFGPQYESIHYTSNQALSTVVREFFQRSNVELLEEPRKRPDLVAVPEGLLSIHSSDSFDEDGVNGYDKILIIELKRPGKTLQHQDLAQTLEYVAEIVNCGKIQPDTEVVGYLLGSERGPTVPSESTHGKRAIVYPRTYDTILRRAHNRTFELHEKLGDEIHVQDQDIQDLLSQQTF